jgi:hypothetical protein
LRRSDRYILDLPEDVRKLHANETDVLFFDSANDLFLSRHSHALSLLNKNKAGCAEVSSAPSPHE